MLQVKPVFQKPRFPGTHCLSPSPCHALFAYPLPPLLLGENLPSALMPKHPEGLRWLFLPGHLLFLLVKQPSTIARNASFPEVLQGKSLWILHFEYQLPEKAIDCAYACFWIWGAPDIHTTLYFAPSILVGMSFLPARKQTSRSRQCTLLSFAGPRASHMGYCMYRLCWHLVGLWTEGRVPLPLSVQWQTGALCEMHTESFSAWTWCHVPSFSSFFTLGKGDTAMLRKQMRHTWRAASLFLLSMAQVFFPCSLSWPLPLAGLQWPSNFETTLPSWFRKRTWNSTLGVCQHK